LSNILIASGEVMNLLERVSPAQITVSDEDPQYPIAGLYDRDGANPFRFLTQGPLSEIAIDGDLTKNDGAFETDNGGIPANWVPASTGTGTAVYSTANPRAGSTGHLRINGGASGVGALRYRMKAAARERLRVVSFWVDSNGAAVADLYIRNKDTGNYSVGGVWTATPGAAVSSNSAAYANAAATPYQFTVEDFEDTTFDGTTLDFTIRTNANAAIDVDDFAVIMETDLLVMHGHVWLPGGVLSWEHSDDDITYTPVAASIPLYQPSLYSVPASASTKRYHSIFYTGDNDSPGYVGELVLAQKIVLERNPNYPEQLPAKRAFIEQETALGAIRRYALADTEVRTWRAPYSLHGTDQMRQYRDKVFRRSGLGEHKVIVVPEDDDPEVVLYGSLVDAQSNLAKASFNVWNADDLAVVEDAFPTGVP
jgi:hypothetical protein